MQSRTGSSFPVALFCAAVFLFASSSLLSQESRPGRSCDITGTWYGGSVVAYQMTIIPALPANHYIVFAEGMYKNAVMNTVYTGEVVKKGNLYEGSLMQLSTADADFLNPPPIGKLPDIYAGWTSMELTDCNTIQNTLPFFGIYFGNNNIWRPGIEWIPTGKVPLVDKADVDLLDVLNSPTPGVPGSGKPIVESYHRLSNSVNPNLLRN